MRGFLSELIYLFDRRERRNALILLVLMIIGALLEVVGVGAIPAFVTLLSDPQRALTITPVRRVFAALHATTPESRAIWAAVALCAVFVLKNTYQTGQIFLQARFMMHRQQRITCRLFQAYLDSPYTFHLQHNTAQLINNACVAGIQVASDVMLPLLRFLMEMAVLVAVVTLLVAVEPAVSVIMIVLTGGAVVGFLKLIRKRVTRFGREEYDYRAYMFQSANQGLGGIKDVKVLGREARFLEAFANMVGVYTRAGNYKTVALEMPRLFLETVAVIVMVVVAAYFLMIGRQVQTIVPLLTLLAVAALRLIPSANRITSAVLSFKWGLPSLHAVYADIRSLERPAQEPKRKREIAGFQDAIAFENVSYQYPGAATSALHKITLRIPKGTTAGLVGPSGAGKTTTVDLLLGLLEPSHGRVTVDGHDIRDDIRGWQRQIGYIPQQVYLTDDSIRRNIAFGLADAEVDEQALWAAIDAAQLRELVESLPNGVETLVGERGIRLSGGQRQRIAIARALYHNPPVLVMDEATSALDQETEREFVRALERLAGTRTIVAIAHRITTVKDCDQLFFFSGGELTAAGTYNHLQESSEAFRSLVA